MSISEPGHIYNRWTVNFKKILFFTNRFFCAWNTFKCVRFVQIFSSFEHLNSSLQKDKMGPNSTWKVNGFDRPQICLFGREILKCPNELKIGMELTPWNFFHAKNKSYFQFFSRFFLFYCSWRSWWVREPISRIASILNLALKMCRLRNGSSKNYTNNIASYFKLCIK